MINNIPLEKEFIKRFQLKDAFIVKSNGFTEIKQYLGEAAAFYLSVHLGTHEIIGITGGRTVSQDCKTHTLWHQDRRNSCTDDGCDEPNRLGY